ncbi:MAG: CapA family protein [Blautia sp.]|nr:CapA family protein [Blautia sp.]MCM1199655.1 CapA family protein [Bacteroides fragilis]
MKKIAFVILAFSGIGAACYLLWSAGAFLPGWILWEKGSIRDTSGAYEVLLNRKTADILYEDGVIWTSPEGVKVQAALSCDIDNDGADELLLLCWKRGRYGEHKPFWVERDEKTWSQHLFVYEYAQGEIRPEWMSSYIGQDVAAMAIRDGAPPGKHLLLTSPDGGISSWFWDSWGFTKEKPDTSFVVFGDNLIHEPIYRYGLRGAGNAEGRDLGEADFSFLYENVSAVIEESDVAVISQETPFVDEPALYGDYPRFGTPIQAGEAIADAGFDVAACATNHALDRGVEGINRTKAFFTDKHIKCLGIQSEEETDYHPCEILVRNGVRFALLNYTYGTNGIRLPEENPNMVHLLDDEDKITNDIKTAKAESDFVIVFVHWGTEYAGEPDDFQRKWAQVFAGCRADVVVGTHPHAVQPCEVIRGGDGYETLVYYSIGNYISAQPEEACVKGGMASFTVSLTPAGYKVTEYDFRPLTIRRQEGGKYVTEF